MMCEKKLKKLWLEEKEECREVRGKEIEGKEIEGKEIEGKGIGSAEEAGDCEKVGWYEAVVSVCETLRYCSDKKHPLTLRELQLRCLALNSNWIELKRLKRIIDTLLRVRGDADWVKEHGGQVMKVRILPKDPTKKPIYGVCWKKDENSVALEKILRRDLENGESGDICQRVLDKLGMSADIQNEEGWRKYSTKKERLDNASRIKVMAPYEEQIFQKQCDMGLLN